MRCRLLYNWSGSTTIGSTAAACMRCVCSGLEWHEWVYSLCTGTYSTVGQARCTTPITASVVSQPRTVFKNIIRIGTPGYKLTQGRDQAPPEGMAYGQRWVLIEASYPNSEAGIQPRHRFISAFEQKIEAPSKDWQYLVLACDPYDNLPSKFPINLLIKMKVNL